MGLDDLWKPNLRGRIEQQINAVAEGRAQKDQCWICKMNAVAEGQARRTRQAQSVQDRKSKTRHRQDEDQIQPAKGHRPALRESGLEQKAYRTGLGFGYEFVVAPGQDSAKTHLCPSSPKTCMKATLSIFSSMRSRCWTVWSFLSKNLN
eukprot:scaffold162749_cov20-Tisochrysis_lutea.AAC.1